MDGALNSHTSTHLPQAQQRLGSTSATTGSTALTGPARAPMAFTAAAAPEADASEASQGYRAVPAR